MFAVWLCVLNGAHPVPVEVESETGHLTSHVRDIPAQKNINIEATRPSDLSC